jgi:hypothetical protein
MTTMGDDSGRDRLPRCGADTGHGSCKQPAGWGTEHVGIGRCKLHGGSTPSHVVAARQVQAREAVVTYGLPVDVSPAEALLEEVRWTAGHVVWLRERVQALEADGVADSVWVDLYQRERKHGVDVAAAAVRAGVDVAMVRLKERQGEALVVALRRLMDGLGLSERQEVRLREAWPVFVAELTGRETAG